MYYSKFCSTQYHSISSDSYSVHSKRKVPVDLLSTNPIHVEYKWGCTTYKYYHLFDSSIETTVYNNNEEVISWTRKANRIQNELKGIGYDSAVGEIIRLFKEEFKLLGTDGQNPKHLTDFMTIIKNPIWYNSDKNCNRTIIFRLEYGLFRNG